MSMTDTGDTLTAYHAHLQAKGLRAATTRVYCDWPKRLAADTGPLRTLTRADIEAWISAQTWQPATQRKAVQALRYFFAWMLDVGLIDRDPAASLVCARQPRAIPHPCPEADYQAALAAASGADYWRLRLAADTGMRRAEIAACCTSDLMDLPGGQALRIDGKGGVVRAVPIPADLAAWIAAQRGWCCPSRQGGHLTPNYLGTWFTRHLGHHVHTLRHRYASRAYAAGHDIEAVRQLLGHASVATTQRYIGIDDQALVAAARAAWTARPLRAA